MCWQCVSWVYIFYFQQWFLLSPLTQSWQLPKPEVRVIKFCWQIWHSWLQVKMDFHLWRSVVSQSKIFSRRFLDNISSADLHILQQNTLLFLMTIFINPGSLVRLCNALSQSNFRNAWQEFTWQVATMMPLVFVQVPQGTTEAQLLLPPSSQ